MLNMLLRIAKLPSTGNKTTRIALSIIFAGLSGFAGIGVQKKLEIERAHEIDKELFAIRMETNSDISRSLRLKSTMTHNDRILHFVHVIAPILTKKKVSEDIIRAIAWSIFRHGFKYTRRHIGANLMLPRTPEEEQERTATPPHVCYSISTPRRVFGDEDRSRDDIANNRRFRDNTTIYSEHWTTEEMLFRSVNKILLYRFATFTFIAISFISIDYYSKSLEPEKVTRIYKRKTLKKSKNNPANL